MSTAKRQFPSKLALPAATSRSALQQWPQWLGWGTAGQGEMPVSIRVHEAQARGAQSPTHPTAKGLFMGISTFPAVTSCMQESKQVS